MAAAEMFNFLQRVVLMPEPGVYAAGPDSKRRTPTRPGWARARARACSTSTCEPRSPGAGESTPEKANTCLITD